MTRLVCHFLKPKAHTAILVTHYFVLLFTINRETSIYAGMTGSEGERGREIMDEQKTERDKRIHETERARGRGRKRKKEMTGKR